MFADEEGAPTMPQATQGNQDLQHQRKVIPDVGVSSCMAIFDSKIAAGKCQAERRQSL